MNENITCVDCGKTSRGYCLEPSGDYYGTRDHEPEFRYEEYSRRYPEMLKVHGVKTE